MVIFFVGLGCGWTETCGNVMLIALFGDKADVFMQSCHIAYGLGATGVPVLVEQMINLTSFHWAIWSIAVTVSLTAFICLIASFGDIPMEDHHPDAFSEPLGVRHRDGHKPSYYPYHERPISHFIVLFASSIFLFSFSFVHEIFITWWYTYASRFVISQSTNLDISKLIDVNGGNILMSCYWGAFTLARLLVKVQLLINPLMYLFFTYTIGCLFLIFVTYVDMTHQNNFILIWVITCLVGFFNSGVFSAAITLPGELFVWLYQSDGVILSLVTFLGEMLGPLIFSYLFFLPDHRTHLMYWLFVIVFAVSQIFSVFVLSFFAFSSYLDKNFEIFCGKEEYVNANDGGLWGRGTSNLSITWKNRTREVDLVQ
eukprot:TRINITY_DN6995_c0_g2_i2.p1 TRINITY_DN6995_c0_g2~~TRINITY_DN6995_c0_g2_i2.p1  ORF type:complete len:370 (-),score=54.96 TRINITY_DN6995_c0_g2_i2:127-1236(-)